jgi:signal peptidase I
MQCYSRCERRRLAVYSSVPAAIRAALEKLIQDLALSSELGSSPFESAFGRRIKILCESVMAKKNRRRSAQPGMSLNISSPPQTETVVPRIMNEEAGAFSREGVESIIVAILLALMFRAFEAEAFVIPTGSMAPTLRGRHKDISCPECGEQWQAGASLNAELGTGPVVSVTCPLCRYPRKIEKERANDSSFSGDRILVNKFAYQFGNPNRWDVIVFKYPGNAKQNYIKRLVGLPNEKLRIRGGDVFAKADDETEYQILRKPPKVMLTLLQPIFDSEHIPQSIIEASWPKSWFSPDDTWETAEDRTSHSVEANDEIEWINYRHLPLSNADWKFVRLAKLPPNIRERKGQLVTDFYAYNAYAQNFRQDIIFRDVRMRKRAEADLAKRARSHRIGEHWVGDLAFECLANVKSDTGTVVLRLVEGGRRLDCSIDVATGQAILTTSEGAFEAGAGQATTTELTAATSMQGAGKYRLRFANVDDQLRFWVNEKLATFAAEGQEYSGAYTGFDARPAFSEEEPGDLYPVRVGCKNGNIELSKLRVLRDIYYTALRPNARTEYANNVSTERIEKIITTPELWKEADLFAFAEFGSRRGRSTIEFALGEDQFFPMGDNSPQSKDARLWSEVSNSLHSEDGRFLQIEPGAYVDRSLLIGKAFLIYWPHGWYPGGIKTPFPFLPNVGGMGRIR